MGLHTGWPSRHDRRGRPGRGGVDITTPENPPVLLRLRADHVSAVRLQREIARDASVADRLTVTVRTHQVRSGPAFGSSPWVEILIGVTSAGSAEIVKAVVQEVVRKIRAGGGTVVDEAAETDTDDGAGTTGPG